MQKIKKFKKVKELSVLTLFPYRIFFFHFLTLCAQLLCASPYPFDFLGVVCAHKTLVTGPKCTQRLRAFFQKCEISKNAKKLRNSRFLTLFSLPKIFFHFLTLCAQLLCASPYPFDFLGVVCARKISVTGPTTLVTGPTCTETLRAEKMRD